MFITELTLDQIKTAANRLRQHLPEKKRHHLLDICTHQLTGINSYSEAQRAAKSLLEELPPVPEGWLDIRTYGEFHGIEPTLKQGYWYYYPEHTSLVFEGFKRPYPINLVSLSDTSKLMDMTLHLHRKRTPKKHLKGRLRCESFQVDEFLSLLQDLSKYYFEESLQGIYSPFGKYQEVDWQAAIKAKSRQSQITEH